MMGLTISRIDVDEDHHKISLFVEDEALENRVPAILSALEHLVNLMLTRGGEQSYIIDLNYYRKERERLITELARAAAKKAMVSKKEVELPPMNAYERRLVHVEITTHPDLKTESVGLGKDRRIVIKHLS
ncbi:MAG: R3H domain-containing nucleic acid-binding protein [Patescibacteria group bacterium]